MNLISKISLVVSIISFMTLIIARIVFASWISYMWWPLGIFLIGGLVSLIFNFKFYWSLFSMKTTKEGMSLGLSVVVAIVILGSIGYLGKTSDQTFDLTREKLFSLSDQTITVLDSMKEKGLKFTVLFKGDEGRKNRESVDRTIQIFKQEAPHLKVRYHDAYKNNKLAKEYLSDLSNKSSQSLFMFVEYLSKKIEVAVPFQEGQILSALNRVSRRVQQKIYYTVGHGERDLNSALEDGVQLFKQSLKESSYNVQEWDFISEQKTLPKDTTLVMILGPTKPFFEQELKWIQKYLKSGGNLLVAVDPGLSHNLTPFLKKQLGVDFRNNFIISSVSRFLGRSETSVLGLIMNRKAPVMQAFSNKNRINVIFDEVSEVEFTSNKPNSNWEQGYIIKSDPSSFTINSFSNSKKKRPQTKPRTIGVYVQEVASSSSPQVQNQSLSSKKDGFSAVVFGDSDFLTNRNWRLGDHKDLASSVVAYLSNQDDLITLKPKAPKGTAIFLGVTAQYIFIIFACFLPILFFTLGGITWYIRKRA